MAMGTMLLAGLGGARAQSYCAGDVCVGNSMMNPNVANWAKTPFDKCPTATNGDCDLPASTIYRETRCELGTRARTSGLADWMPVEFPQTDAALGGILTYKEVRSREPIGRSRDPMSDRPFSPQPISAAVGIHRCRTT
jgi:hypothetical protein